MQKVQQSPTCLLIFDHVVRGFVDLTLGEAFFEIFPVLLIARANPQAFTCGLTANAELLCWGSSLDFELQVLCRGTTV